MRILIYGAGVLGSLYAARLTAAGDEVMVLARGRRLAELRARGVVLEDALSGQRTVTPVAAIERLEPDDAYDLGDRCDFCWRRVDAVGVDRLASERDAAAGGGRR